MLSCCHQTVTNKQTTGHAFSGKQFQLVFPFFILWIKTNSCPHRSCKLCESKICEWKIWNEKYVDVHYSKGKVHNALFGKVGPGPKERTWFIACALQYLVGYTKISTGHHMFGNVWIFTMFYSCFRYQMFLFCTLNWWLLM